MLYGKKERQLEEELEKVRQQNEDRRGAIQAVYDQKENIGEQVSRTRDFLKKLTNGVGQVQEKISQISEQVENGAKAASDIHSEMIKMNNTVESFDANHSVFLGKLKDQNDKMMQLLEDNRRISPVMEALEELQDQMSEGCKNMEDAAKDMQIFAKNMSVKSLNAAVEAGKMGESGSRFVAAAEDVRNFAQQYDQAAGRLAMQLEGYIQQAGEISAQMEQVKSLLKEQTTALGSLAAGAMQSMTDYKSGQLELHGILQDTVVGKSDMLQQSGHEILRLKDQVTLRMEDMQEELNGQKDTADELDRAIKTMWQAVDGRESNQSGGIL